MNSIENKQNFFERTPVVITGALICCLLWGSAFPCVKLGYAFTGVASTDTASQIMYAGVRFTLAGILAVIAGSFINKKPLYPSRRAIPKVMLLSLFQTILQYFFFYIGLARTSGVKASIIEATNVFVAVIVAGVIFKLETTTAKKIIGCVVGFAGVILVNLNGFSIEALKNLFSGLSVMGEGFIFFSTVAYAFSSVILKKFSKDENPVMMSGYQFIFGGLVMAVFGALFGGKLDIFNTKAMLMLIYLAFVSAAAYSLWGTLLKYNPVSKVAVFGFMNPVFGVILSAWLLNEADSIGIMSVIALVLVCIGIWIVNGKSKKKDSL